nr:retrovirus-related Pol polyprotein from transposon TNT 1-94 [Tanacetum cinerariifolium]
MLLCKQAEQGVPLQAKQYDWLADTDDEVDEQELEAHYSYMAKIQEVPIADSGTDSEPVEQVQNEAGYNVFANQLQHSEQSESVSNTCLVETDDSNVIPDLPDMCEDDIQNEQNEQNDVESDDERVALANLIANLKLDQEMHVDLKYVESLKKEIDELEYDKAEFSNMYDEILQDCVSKDVMCPYLQSLSDLDALAKLQCMYLHKVKECDCLAQKLSKQTEYVSKKVHNELLQRFSKVEKHSISLELALQKCKEQVKNDTVCNENASNVFRKEREHYFKIQDLKAQLQDKNISISELKKLIEKGKGKSVDTKFDRPYTLLQAAKKAVCNTNVLKPGMYRIDNRTTHTRAPQLPQTVRNTNPRVSTSTGVNHNINVSRPQLKSNQSRDKSVTTCKDSLNSKTLNANAVCATCNKCLVDSNHFACVTKILNNVHARTKKPNVVPISTRKPKSQAKKSIATPHKKKVASKSINQKPQCYFRVLYENTNKAWKWWIERQSPSGYKWVPKPKKQWVPKAKMQWLAPILGYGDLVQGNVTINRVYYVEGLNHNLFSVGQFCDADLEVAFRKSTCFVRDLQGNDLLIDDYSRYTWTLFLRSKNETPEVLKDFLTMIQRNLQAPVITVRTDRGTEFLNKTLNAFFKEERIEHQTSTARTPEQNDVVERQNRTLVEAARTMLSALQLPFYERKRDRCILVGYSTHLKGYRVYNKRTIMIFESIHIRFDEIKEVSETSVANNTSGLIPQRQKASDYDNPDPVPQRRDVSSLADEHVPLQQELDLLFGPLYDEFINAGSNPSTNIQSTLAPSTHTNVHAEENNNDQAEKGEQLQDAEFTNPFCAPTQDVVESSSHNIGDKLVSWMSKKQNCTTMSSAEAEYVALSVSCAQVMWIRTQLQDYGFNYNKIPLYCDSQSAIAISCNPVQHSRTKHIYTRYHFIKEQVENGIIELYFVRTEYQLADMFIKALPEDRFKYLVRRIGMRCLTPAELEVLAKESA